jgi:hypothetical protein
MNTRNTDNKLTPLSLIYNQDIPYRLLEDIEVLGVRNRLISCQQDMVFGVRVLWQADATAGSAGI